MTVLRHISYMISYMTMMTPSRRPHLCSIPLPKSDSSDPAVATNLRLGLDELSMLASIPSVFLETQPQSERPTALSTIPTAVTSQADRFYCQLPSNCFGTVEVFLVINCFILSKEEERRNSRARQIARLLRACCGSSDPTKAWVESLFTSQRELRGRAVSMYSANAH